MKYPFIPGHELVATVVDMGRRANKTIKTFGGAPFKIGDRVSINPRIVCGICYYCQNLPQRPEMCINARTYNSSITSDIPPYLFGGWAEYMYVLPGSEIIKVPDGLSDDKVVLAEPFACALGCIDRYQREHDWITGDAFAIEGTVVVYGAGAIGMLMIAGFHLCGTQKIVAIDVIDKKLELAREFGATDTLNAATTSFSERSDAIKILTSGIGAHIIIEACGIPAVITEGVKMLRRGGKLFVVGHLLKTKSAEIDPQKICRNELEILGNYAYPSSNYFHRAFQILLEDRLPYHKMTLSVPLLEAKKYIINKMPKAVKMAIEM
jgi:L-iditol 2-dehydrogenase